MFEIYEAIKTRIVESNTFVNVLKVSVLFDLQEKFKKVCADVNTICDGAAEMMKLLHEWINSETKEEDVHEDLSEETAETDDEENLPFVISDFEARRRIEAWIARFFVQWIFEFVDIELPNAFIFITIKWHVYINVGSQTCCHSAVEIRLEIKIQKTHFLVPKALWFHDINIHPSIQMIDLVLDDSSKKVFCLEFDRISFYV